MEIRQQVVEEVKAVELQKALTTESILQEIYDFCKKQAEEAASVAETSRDREAAARCFIPVTSILNKMVQPKPDTNKGASAIIAYVESERAKE
jgi:hypothetical protein